jgi:8-oxo-dGTP pyrophosphatase MutT (NUDIX family)
MATSSQSFISALQHDLQQPLPGRSAQYNMAPKPRPGAEWDDAPNAGARQSSVLILFYPYAGSVYFPLMLRPTYPGVHSGQVGLPGGGFEEGDNDLIDTALREAQEEIGVDPVQINVIGQLTTLYIRPSNNLVLPVVGWVAERPNFLPDPHEVALLIEASLLEFLDPANFRTEVWELATRTANVPLFGVQNQVIWGATAMILGELLALPAMRQVPGLGEKNISRRDAEAQREGE